MSDEMRLQLYRALPYTRITERMEDESGVYYVCSYPDLPGLTADGTTVLEAQENAKAAFDDYVRARLRWGDEIPEPPGAARMRRALANAANLTSGPVLLELDAQVALPDEPSRRRLAADVEQGLITRTRSAGDPPRPLPAPT